MACFTTLVVFTKLKNMATKQQMIDKWGKTHTIKKVIGTEIQLGNLNKNESVVYGDGKTFHWLITLKTNDVKTGTVQVKGDVVLTLYSFSSWVNKVPHNLPKKLPGESFIWIDKNGNGLFSGEDFAAAKNAGTFPVRVIRSRHEL